MIRENFYRVELVKRRIFLKISAVCLQGEFSTPDLKNYLHIYFILTLKCHI